MKKGKVLRRERLVKPMQIRENKDGIIKKIGSFWINVTQKAFINWRLEKVTLSPRCHILVSSTKITSPHNEAGTIISNETKEKLIKTGILV